MTEPGHTAWCERCDWNVIPGRGSTIPDRRTSAAVALPAPTAAAPGESVEHRPARISVGLLAVIAVSIPVHLLTLGIVLLAIAFLAQGLDLVNLVIAGILLALAWVLRPRFSRVPAGALSRENVPHLIALVDRVGAEIGAPRVDRVVLDGDWNAAVGRAGVVRRHVVLWVGTPLWAALEPAQRVALLGHEMAHLRNRDPIRSWVGALLIDTLREWADLLRPDALLPQGAGVVELLSVPFTALMLGVAKAIDGVRAIVQRVSLRDRRQAERWADQMGARVAGPDAMAGLLKSLDVRHHLYIRTLEATAAKGAGGFFARLARELAEDPASAHARRERALHLVPTDPLATHPRTLDRIGWVERTPRSTAAVTLGSDASAAIDRELAGHDAAIERELAREYEGSYRARPARA